MNATDTFRPRRLIQLDFLRGIAVLLVLMHHTALHNTALGWLAPIEPLIGFGWGGVTLFFVLSGFLVSGLMFHEIRRTGRIDVRRFLARRAFKIWPAYFAFLLFCLARFIYHKGTLWEAIKTYWPNFLHIQNYVYTPAQHTWSLAIEEHFYLAFSLFLFLLMRGEAGRRRLRVIPWVALGLLAACLALRVANLSHSYSVYRNMWPTHLRIDSLFLGVCLGYYYHFRPEVFEGLAPHRIALAVLGLALNVPMLILISSSPFVSTMGHMMMPLGFACLLAAVVPPPSRAALPSRLWRNPLVNLVAWVGLYSYSIYLWHLDLAKDAVFFWLGPLWRAFPANWQGPAYMALYLSGCVLVGVVMGKLIEFPALRLRERLMPARGPAGSTLPSPEAQPLSTGGDLNPATVKLAV